MIDFMQLPADEAERLCYAEGFEKAAELFKRIADLEAELIEARRTIDLLNIELDQERSQ